MDMTTDERQARSALRIRRYITRQRAILDAAHAANITLRCESCGDRFTPTYGVDRCEPCARENERISRLCERAQEAGR